MGTGDTQVGLDEPAAAVMVVDPMDATASLVRVPPDATLIASTSSSLLVL